MLEKFKQIKSPEELIKFLIENISTGYVGKNGKVYYPSNQDYDSDLKAQYLVQDAKNVLKSGLGTCFEYARVASECFRNTDYNFQTFFLYYDTSYDTYGNNNKPTHAFLVFKREEKWYWFEASFIRHAGIHEYKTLESLLKDVKHKVAQYDIKTNHATKEETRSIKFIQYECIPGIVSIIEFLDNIFNGGNEIVV